MYVHWTSIQNLLIQIHFRKPMRVQQRKAIREEIGIWNIPTKGTQLSAFSNVKRWKHFDWNCHAQKNFPHQVKLKSFQMDGRRAINSKTCWFVLIHVNEFVNSDEYYTKSIKSLLLQVEMFVSSIHGLKDEQFDRYLWKYMYRYTITLMVELDLHFNNNYYSRILPCFIKSAKIKRKSQTLTFHLSLVIIPKLVIKN